MKINSVEVLKGLRFGDQLRLLIKCAGVSQSELAKNAEVGEDTISRYVNGYRNKPYDRTVEKFARYFSKKLNLPFDELLEVLKTDRGVLSPDDPYTIGFASAKGIDNLINAVCRVRGCLKKDFLVSLIELDRKTNPEDYEKAEEVMKLLGQSVNSKTI